MFKKNKKGQIILGGIVLAVFVLIIYLIGSYSYPQDINVQVTPLETDYDDGSTQTLETIPVLVGNEPIIYSQQYDSDPFFIGELVFTSNQPKWACSIPSTPNARFSFNTECIATEITYGGKQHIIRHGETVRLDRFLEVTYEPTGIFYFSDLGAPYFRELDDWTNQYTFNFVDATFLDIEIQPLGTVAPNQDAQMKLTTTNAYTGFVGGIVLTTDRQIISDYVIKEKVFKVSRGATIVNIDVPTDVFGDVKVKITPFITINGKNYYSTKSRIGEYSVQPTAIEEKTFFSSLGGLFQ